MNMYLLVIRVYKVDTKTFEIIDSITYSADLSKATDLNNEPVSQLISLIIFFFYDEQKKHL